MQKLSVNEFGVIVWSADWTYMPSSFNRELFHCLQAGGMEQVWTWQ